MSNKFLIFTISLLLFVGCGAEKQKLTSIESWQDYPSAKSTRIRVITNLSEQDLQRNYIDRVLTAKFMIDTKRGLKPMTTMVKRISNYYVRLYIYVENGTASIYGEEGNLGMNAIASGQEPSASNISWSPIKFNGRGWDIMNAVSGDFPNSKKEYNHLTEQKIK